MNFSFFGRKSSRRPRRFTVLAPAALALSLGGCPSEEGEEGACVFNYGTDCYDDTEGLCEDEFHPGTSCDELAADRGTSFDSSCNMNTSCIGAISNDTDVNGDPIAWQRCISGANEEECGQLIFNAIWSATVTCAQQNFDVGCDDHSWYHYEDECTRQGYGLTDDPGGFCYDGSSGGAGGSSGGAGGANGGAGGGSAGTGVATSGGAGGGTGCAWSDGIWVTDSVEDPSFTGFRTRLIEVVGGVPVAWCHFAESRGYGRYVDCLNADQFSLTGDTTRATVDYIDSVWDETETCTGWGPVNFEPFDVQLSGCGSEILLDLPDGSTESYTQKTPPAGAKGYCGF